MQALRRRLLQRKTFVPWGSGTPFKAAVLTPLLAAPPPPDTVVRMPSTLIPGCPQSSRESFSGACMRHVQHQLGTIVVAQP